MSRAEVRGSQKGFTLIEIAIVLAIAAIVTTLAVPNFIGIFPRIRLSNSTFTLSNEIALARARSIAKNQEFRITFNTSDNSYTLRNETTNADFARNTTSRGIDIYQVDNLDPDDTLAVKPVGTVGRANSSGDYENLPIGTIARIYLQTGDAAYRKRVVVESTGRLYIERWKGGTTWMEEG